MKWVRIRKAAELTGYTENAIRMRIKQGHWPEHIVWRRAPDRSLWVSPEGLSQWVEGRAH